jgi:CRISPR/Cas system-associated exonuclease Cas4 (RecB family)
MGQPEVLVYAETDGREREPFCIPLLAISEDLAPNREPDERHLVRGAAQCLLLERAYKLSVDLGVIEFRNRVVSFAMTNFAREWTEEVLDEIRRLQTHNG